MTAGTLNIVIEVGAKYSKALTWQDSAGAYFDTTLYTAEMHIRASASSAAILLALRSVAPTATEGTITLGGAIANNILLEVGADVTDDITWTAGVYDLELTEIADPTNVIRLIQGKVKTIANVTRP
jgi:hypothetical protein